MQLKILNNEFSVMKLPPTEEIPSWAIHAEVFSIMRTDEELSIVCPSDSLPENEGHTFNDI